MFGFNVLYMVLPASIGKTYVDRSGERKSWTVLNYYSAITSFLAVVLYLLTFTFDGDAGGRILSSCVGVVFLLDFIGYTPLLYIVFKKDSIYWRQQWLAALKRVEIPSSLTPSASTSTLRDNLLDGASVSSYNTMHSGSGRGTNGVGVEVVDDSVTVDYTELAYEYIVGIGSYGDVYAGQWQGKRVAIKHLHMPKITLRDVQSFLRECALLRCLAHPHVLTFYGASISPPDFTIVTELCLPHSLGDVISASFEALVIEAKTRMANAAAAASQVKSDAVTIDVDTKEKVTAARRLATFSQLDACKIARAVASAMAFIHAQGILHRDLKTANVLFDSSGRPKLCDFGLSHPSDYEGDTTEELNESQLYVGGARDSFLAAGGPVFRGTLAYMAPEVLTSTSADNSSDVYAFGILFWEILHTRPAWTDSRVTPATLFHIVTQKQARPGIAKGVHNTLAQLLKAAWHQESSKRPSFESLVEMLTSHMNGIQSS
jgi:hypothetical protein